MATRVFFVRHGATTLTAEDRFAGSTDVELSGEGRDQAARLAERLANEPLDAIYCSPLARTRATAAPIAKAHDLESELRPELREIDHGRWEQMRRSEVEQKFADEYAAWELDPFTFAPKGGESGLQVLARALPMVREAVVAHANGSLAIVSHKATIRFVVASLLGLDPRNTRDRLDLAPASLTVLDFKDPVRARLALYNDTSHYSIRPREPDTALSKWWDSSPPKRS